MVVALLLASCGPSVTEDKEVAPPEKEGIVMEEEVASPGSPIREDLGDKNILTVIAPKDFMDEELFRPKEIMT